MTTQESWHSKRSTVLLFHFNNFNRPWNGPKIKDIKEIGPLLIQVIYPDIVSMDKMIFTINNYAKALVLEQNLFNFWVLKTKGVVPF